MTATGGGEGAKTTETKCIGPVDAPHSAVGGAKRTDVRSPTRRHAELTKKERAFSLCVRSPGKRHVAARHTGQIYPLTLFSFSVNGKVLCSGSWTECNRCLHALEPP
jgi:hypothetical protein